MRFPLVVGFLLSAAPALSHQGPSDCRWLLVEGHLAYESMVAETLIGTPQAPRVSREQFLEAVKQLALGITYDARFQAALAQAEKSHGAMVRESGASYMEEHVYPVALSALRQWRFNAALQGVNPVEVLVAALLHDTLEDDESLTARELGRVYGPVAAEAVTTMTKRGIHVPGLEGMPLKWAKNKVYAARFGRAGAVTITVKLADRLNNIMGTWAQLHNARNLTAGHAAVRKAISYVVETEEFFLPLAQGFSFHYYLSMKHVLDGIKRELEPFGPWASLEVSLRREIYPRPRRAMSGRWSESWTELSRRITAAWRVMRGE